MYPVDSSIGRRCGVPYGYTLVVDVPIGSVDVTGSRESLSLDDATTAYLNERFTAVAQEITAHIESVVDECPSYVAATKLWWAKYRRFRDTVKYRGTVINSVIPLAQCTARLESSGIDKSFALHRARPTKTNGMHILQVPVDMIEGMKIVVDDGTKVKRKTARLRAAGKAHRDTFVADPAQAATVSALLELAPDQLVPLSSLPDPGPSQRSAQQRLCIELPSTPFLWGLRTRSTYEFPAIWDEEMKMDDARWRSVSAALRALGEERPVEYFTPTQAKRLGLLEADRVDVVLEALVNAAKPIIEAQHRQDCLNGAVARLIGAMPYGTTREQRITVLKSVVGDSWFTDVDATEIVPDSVMAVARRLGVVGENRSPANLTTVMNDVRKKFPLLFAQQPDIVQFYITNTIAEATK